MREIKLWQHDIFSIPNNPGIMKEKAKRLP